MMPMNNPLAIMTQMLRQGQNPMALLGQMSQQNPQVAQMMRMMQGKNSQQLSAMAQNMARERGVNLDALAQQLGLRIPNN